MINWLKQLQHCGILTLKQVLWRSPFYHLEMNYKKANGKKLRGCSCGCMFGKYTDDEKELFLDIIEMLKIEMKLQEPPITTTMWAEGVANGVVKWEQVPEAFQPAVKRSLDELVRQLNSDQPLPTTMRNFKWNSKTKDFDED